MATRSEDPTWVGSVHLSPTEPVAVGSHGTWVFTYVVGPHGLDDGGGLKILLRSNSDWGVPQLKDPAAPNYVRVLSSGAPRVSARWDARAHVRPWPKGLVVELHDDGLAEGETITVVWGDRSGGSPGAQVQTFAEREFRFQVLADCHATGLYLPVPGATGFPIVPAEAARLVAVAPSDAGVGSPTWLLVRAEDRYGNPAVGFRGTVSVQAEGLAVAGLPAPYSFTPEDSGAHRFTGLVPTSPGCLRWTVSDARSGLFARSNPSHCSAKPRPLRLLWGDTQAQTRETVGAGTVPEFFAYARDVAGLDFVAHSANDFQVTGEHYAEVCQTARAFYRPGAFVTFPGYEWSGTTPVGGDHNVLYLEEGRAPLHRSSHALLPDRSDEAADRTTITELYATLRAEGVPVLTVPHVGGRRANLALCDPAISPVLEICSVHGWFEWFAQEALALGLKMGFLGASDDHTCRPGASAPARPGFDVRNGLAGVYAADLTREAIAEALRARHCFATTGERMRLMLRCEDHMMGDEVVATAPPRLEARVEGTLPLESAEIVRGSVVVYRHVFPELQDRRVGQTLRVSWKGAR